MAKNDNLKDFLTDVADAIRAKKGSTGLINPQNFSAEIASIETGGGGGASGAAAGAVNFRDYDGTILHSFSKDEFLALTEMPELPSQPRLICQGWNYGLADAQAYVQECGALEVGATYITDDGKTRLHINIAAEGRMKITIYFQQTIANGVSFDWGDGSNADSSISGTGKVKISHTYSSIGHYTISLDVAEGCALKLGHASAQLCIFGNVSNVDRVYCNMLEKIEIGDGVTSIEGYAFQYCYSLASVAIPNSVTSVAANAFYYCYSLTSVVIPNSVTSLGTYTFSSCYSLTSVVIPNGVTSLSNYTFVDCYSLASVVIPNGVTSIGNNAFQNCYSLASVVIPNGVTSIGTYAFAYCYSLASVVIPNSVKSIAANAFNGNTGLAFVDFSAHTSVPTLSATSAFGNGTSDRKIIVPDALYDEWVGATNWSSYSGAIIKASEFNA